ncbi:hypothetical protein [Bacillus wiedmannii]|uniref:hypothetical protein n=1 Tax=Bacillus wiedmannii TaxID=1890302 RepID=UPI00211D29C9|nr:hypothetical protein [Bacillus wiedmannii]
MRKNTAGVVIHNDINSYPFLNIPMIINQKDGVIYEVLSAGFQANDAVAMITTDGFAITWVNALIVTVKNNYGSIQIYRLLLELKYWLISCMLAASEGKNSFPCKVAFGIIDTKFFAGFK